MTKTSKKTSHRRSSRIGTQTKAAKAKPQASTTPTKATASDSPATLLPPPLNSTKRRTTQTQEIRKIPGSPKKKTKVVLSTPGDEPVETYIEAATKSAAPKVWPHQPTDSFVMAKQMREDPPNIQEDDETQSGTNRSSPSHLYASILVSLAANPEAQQVDAPLRTIERVNQMLKPLMNKFPKKVWLAPWMLPEDKIGDSCLRSSFDADSNDLLLDLAEKYLHDFNRFQSWGRWSYMRIHIVFHPSITEEQLLAQMSLCKIKGDGGQFFQKAHSSAKDPIAGGTLTGSVSTMAESPDFHQTFQQKWQLQHLGLYWNFMRSKDGGSYTTKKSTLHIEIDRSDQYKLEEIRIFFNQKSTSVTNQFWGTPMQWVPTWDFKLCDADNDKVERHKDSQYKLGMSLRSCTIFGINPYNLLSKSPYKTLHRALMEVESLYTKYIETVTHNATSLPTKSKKEFKGRLFYAIIPCSTSKKITFHYTTANSDEANSVARAIPHFIQSYFKVTSSHFCNNELIAATKSGHWNAAKRQYRSEEDVIENNKLMELDSSMMAVKEVFIDPSQQRALAVDGDSVISSNTQLTRGEASAARLEDNNSTTSSLTGSTRASKVQRAVNLVSQQHMGAISSMKSKMDLLTDLLTQHGIELPTANDPAVASDRLHLDLTTQFSSSSDESDPQINEAGQISNNKEVPTPEKHNEDEISSMADVEELPTQTVDVDEVYDDDDEEGVFDVESDGHEKRNGTSTPKSSNSWLSDKSYDSAQEHDHTLDHNASTKITTTEGLGSGKEP